MYEMLLHFYPHMKPRS